jgi:ABC-type multidrug transport system fused ATPase/permease subunit
MHKPIYQKFLFYVSLFGFVVSILAGFYDVIFGYLFEVCHLIFEVVELSLDRVVEHVFHTDSRETELIVFYILVVLIALLIFFVWKALVVIVGSISHRFRQDSLLLKEAITNDWEGMAITSKILWICCFLLVNYLVSFLFF